MSLCNCFLRVILLPEKQVEGLRSTANDTKILFPAGHLDDVVAKLGLYRANNFSGIVFECNFLKLRYHLTFTEPTEISPILPGGAGREAFCNCSEIFTIINSFHYSVCLILSFNKDVGCTCLLYHA